MDKKSCLLLFFTVFSFGRSQFVIRYPRSVFENIQLGQPPNGVYIPPDSFLNALRNPSYNGNFATAPQANPNPVNYNLPAPQFNVQPPPAPQQNSVPSSDMTDNNQVEDQRPRRRTIRRRQKISREQNGTPITFSPSVFENIGYGEVPEGVYVPPDSLLNVLRSPSGRRNVQRSFQTEPSNNFGLTGNYGNSNPQYSVQPVVMNEEQTQSYPEEEIKPEAQNGAISSTSVDEEEYGRKLSPRNRARQSTQSRQMPRNRPPSVALDPSMEYPADVPREDMHWVPRSVVQYADFGINSQQGSGRQRTPKRRQSQRKRKPTVAKPDYIEPEYPTRTYSPSEFETIGLGEAPTGVRIPSDSMLNLLKDDDQQGPSVQTVRASTVPQQPRASVSVTSNEDEMQTAENPSQYSRTESQPTRSRSRQGSRHMTTSDQEADGEFGSRTRQRDPVLTFRQSSQLRQAQRRNSGVRRSRDEE